MENVRIKLLWNQHIQSTKNRKKMLKVEVRNKDTKYNRYAILTSACYQAIRILWKLNSNKILIYW